MAHAKDPQSDDACRSREKKASVDEDTGAEAPAKDEAGSDTQSMKHRGESAEATSDDVSDLNASLDEVLDLLALEVERLKESLEFYRLSEHPDKEQLIRWVVQQIDLRQDRLEDIKALILARDDNLLH